MKNRGCRADTHYQLVLILVRAEGKKGFTTTNLTAQLEVGATTLWNWIKYLKELDLVYVSGWERAGKVWVAQYSWGYKIPDEPRPARLPDYQYSRNHRIKIKAARLGVNHATR